MENQYCICFDISFNENINFFLPSAYIAESCNSVINYIEKKASIDTARSYNIELSERIMKMVAICDELKIETLHKKYNAKNKVKKTLIELLQESAFRKIFLQFISFKLNFLLEEIKKNDFPFSINLNRNNPFQRQKKEFAITELRAKFHFKKLEDKTVYTLSLVENDRLISPCNNKIVVLLDAPAWILVDNKIYVIKDINANKITPFLKKYSVEIPEKNSKVYFKTFINDIVKKAEIEAEGFAITQNKTVTNCIIKPYYNFLLNIFLFDIMFAYEDKIFSNQDQKKFHSSISFKDDIEVIQTKRDFDQENKIVEKALLLGLQLHSAGFFCFNETVGHKYENIQQLIEKKVILAENGFEIDLSNIENKKVAKSVGFVTVKYQEYQDWLDVKMQIVCGEFSFSFTQIINHLRSKNPFFELSDGSFFLIPNDWFSKYKLLIEVGQIKEDFLQLKKSQLPIIEAVTSSDELDLSLKKELKFYTSVNLKATLRNYQIEGVKWLINHYNNNLGACLADDMGLGKTLQTLAVLTHVKENLQTHEVSNSLDLFSEISAREEPLKALIIAPSSLVFNWKNEGKKFAPFLKSISYIGNNRKNINNKLGLYDLVFSSYAVALKDIVFLKNLKFRYLILDESQYIKNKNSKIFTAINQIPTEHKITLSGTPIENSLDDLWSQMQFINPDLLGTFAFFTKYFKIPIEKNQDQSIVGELKNLINPYILRRTKEQVAKDLPALSEQIFLSEMGAKQKVYYEQEKAKARNTLLRLNENESTNKLNVLNAITRLRQISNHAKLVDATLNFESGKFLDVIEYLETLIKSKQKVLLFSSFVKHIEIYTDWCKKAKIDFCKLTGETSISDRENQVDEFQNNPNKLLFFISLKAGGVGLNLTAASYVLLLDPWWNPFAENQAIARAHRIGQKQNVTVVRFIAKDTVEEKILVLQKKKKEMAETIIDVDYLPTEIEQDLNAILD
jgi:non-specific serine/threonine protein kinase